MDISKFSFTGRAILLLIAQVIAVAICIGYIEYIYITDILPDRVVNETYEVTDCLVTDEKIGVRSGIVDRYRADFKILYTTGEDGHQYEAWVSGNGLDPSFTTDRASQEDALQEFNIGETYACWYNPEHPELAVLMLRHSWSSTFSLFIPSIILLIVTFYLARNVFQLVSDWLIKKREK